MTAPDDAIAIRPAELSDLDIVVGLWSAMMRAHEAGDPHIRLTAGAESAYRSYIGYQIVAEDGCVLVAEIAGEIIGFCTTGITRNLAMFEPQDYGYLSDLAVAPGHRRRGIGRRLFDATREWLRSRGIDSIQLQYYNFNQRARAFWTAMGFVPYYQRMWLDLDADADPGPRSEP